MGRCEDLGRGVLPIVFGIGLIVTGGAWWFLSRPSDRDVRTAEVSCTLRGVSSCSVPEAMVAGPIVAAAVGALLLIVGTILYAGQPRR